MAYEYERGIIGMLGGIEDRHFIDLSDKQKRLMKLETLIRTSIKNIDITQMKKSGGMTQVILLKNTKNYMEDK